MRTFMRMSGVVLALSGCGRINYDAGTDAPPPFLYFGDANTVFRIDLETFELMPFVTTLTDPEGLTLDATTSLMYITDDTDRAIFAVPLAGGATRTVVSSTVDPEGIAVDTASQTIFYAGKADGSIRAVDSAGDERVVVSGLEEPDGLAYHAGLDALFYTEKQSGTIGRISPDGSGQVDLITGLILPESITLDEAGDRMLWVQDEQLRSANLDGTDMTEIYEGVIAGGEGVAVDSMRGHVYWTESGGGTLNRIELDGSNYENIMSGLVSAKAVVVGP